MQLERAITKGKVNIMKKIFTTLVTVIITAALVLFGVVKYDDYKKAKERRIERYNRNIRNNLVLDNYEWGEFAIDAFDDGYTVTIHYLRGPEDLLNGVYCELANIDDDTLAKFVAEHPGYKVITVEREHYSRQLEIYRNVEV